MSDDVVDHKCCCYPATGVDTITHRQHCVVGRTSLQSSAYYLWATGVFRATGQCRRYFCHMCLAGVRTKSFLPSIICYFTRITQGIVQHFLTGMEKNMLQGVILRNFRFACADVHSCSDNISRLVISFRWTSPLTCRGIVWPCVETVRRSLSRLPQTSQSIPARSAVRKVVPPANA